jgi:gentisate 1,2-dioxygenase
LTDAGFAEPYPQEIQPLVREGGDAAARYGTNLLPFDYAAPAAAAPIANYPYDKTREALLRLARAGELHPCHGVKMQYANPATGGYPIPTIGAFIQWLPNGYRGDSYRSTDATVYCAVEGRGTSRISGQDFSWGPRDVFLMPSWCEVAHQVVEDAVLFSFSDRPAQKALGFWREQVNID